MKKGFHAVALQGRQVLNTCSSRDPEKIVRWCVETMGAEAVGVDAPCRWSNETEKRPAERALAKAGITCFWTPTKARALLIPFHQWMRNGMFIYAALERTHPLLTKLSPHTPPETPFCFETFPHAVMRALNPVASAQRKRRERPVELRGLGIDPTKLTNLDLIDAALCAVTAQRALKPGGCRSFGGGETGLILVPAP